MIKYTLHFDFDCIKFFQKLTVILSSTKEYIFLYCRSLEHPQNHSENWPIWRYFERVKEVLLTASRPPISFGLMTIHFWDTIYFIFRAEHSSYRDRTRHYSKGVEQRGAIHFDSMKDNKHKICKGFILGDCSTNRSK